VVANLSHHVFRHAEQVRDLQLTPALLSVQRAPPAGLSAGRWPLAAPSIAETDRKRLLQRLCGDGGRHPTRRGWKAPVARSYGVHARGKVRRPGALRACRATRLRR